MSAQHRPHSSPPPAPPAPHGGASSAGRALTQLPQLLPFSRKLAAIRRDPPLYSWDDLATAERQAVWALVHESRRRRQRARRHTVLLTLLLILLLVALMGVVVFGVGSPATFSP